MREWFISDQHFDHTNIVKYVPGFHDTISERNKEIVRKHNERVKNEDTVYVCGDFCFAKPNGFQYWRHQLKGNLVFIQGNHDQCNKVKTKLIRGVLKNKDIFINLVHDPINANPKYQINITGHTHANFKEKSFKNYYEEIKSGINKVNDKKFINKAKRFIDKWKGIRKDKSLLISCCVEARNFYPISLEEILAIYYRWKKNGRTT